jgi:hypothetical protein
MTTEHRGQPRIELVRLSHVTIGKAIHVCELKNISRTGALFVFDGGPHPFKPRDMVGISVEDMGELRGVLRGKVMRMTAKEVAVSFLLTKPEDKQLVADLLAANAG